MVYSIRIYNICIVTGSWYAYNICIAVCLYKQQHFKYYAIDIMIKCIIPNEKKTLPIMHYFLKVLT